MHQLDYKHIDPHHVQISRKQAATILGVSPSELDRLRKSDNRCPKGFKRDKERNARVYFRLSDVYAYSEALIADSIPTESYQDNVDPQT